MFKYQEKENKKLGYKYKNYFLTQGDSFSLSATEVNGNVDEPLIGKVLFKLGLNEAECKINPVFEQEYVKMEDGVWLLKVGSKSTTDWKPTCANEDEPYVYEIEVYFIDGEPETIASGEFTVLPQIGGAL